MLDKQRIENKESFNNKTLNFSFIIHDTKAKQTSVTAVSMFEHMFVLPILIGCFDMSDPIRLQVMLLLVRWSHVHKSLTLLVIISFLFNNCNLF